MRSIADTATRAARPLRIVTRGDDAVGSRADAVDLAAALLLTGLGLVGFRTAFWGPAYLVVGVVGALVGGACAVALTRSGRPVVALCATPVVFALVAVPATVGDHALVGVVPTPGAIDALADGLAHAWIRLLTTLPPAPGSAAMLVVPYTCAFVGAWSATALALRLRGPWCVVPPLGVVAASVLFGVHRPAAVVLQGTVFAAGALWWAATRAERSRPLLTAAARRRRWVGGLVLLVLAAGTASVVGPRTAVASDDGRVVLRDHVEPPFDPRVHASPLVGYRNLVDTEHADDVLLEADGLVEGQALRMAVMDDYDGVVWTTSGDGSASAGVFSRVGARLPRPEGRPGSSLEVTNVGLDGVWLPTPGGLEAVTFTGPRADDLAASFRYNLTTDGAALAGGWTAGDGYDAVVAVPPAPDAERLAELPLAEVTGIGEIPELPESMTSIAADVVSGESTPYGQVHALEEWLQDGYYSDGGPESGVPPGHSLFRLGGFLDAEILVGNAEQYAATMALLLRGVGIPARVVMGFRPADVADRAGAGPVEITGTDADAWVEVPFDGAGWVAFHPTPDRSRIPDQEPEPEVVPNRVETQPPPPTTAPPLDERPEEETETERDDVEDEEPDEVPAGGGAPTVVVVAAAGVGLPLVVLSVAAGIVIALKARRRRRRRRRGAPAQRATASWDELVDLAVDAGTPVPPRATRRAAAEVLDVSGASDLAARVDATIFGPADPADADAEALWTHSDQVRRELVGALGRTDRIRCAVSLSSLRGGR